MFFGRISSLELSILFTAILTDLKTDVPIFLFSPLKGNNNPIFIFSEADVEIELIIRKVKIDIKKLILFFISLLNIIFF